MAAKLWWLMHKDLVSEWRARRAWPAMLLFGAVVAVVFAMQMDLDTAGKRRVVGGLLWLATFFAAMLAIDRSFASEREDGCWEALLLYPVPAAALYAAKLGVNVVAVAALQCVLIPLFVVLGEVPLSTGWGAMAAVAALGNLGISAVGTLLSAVVAAVRPGGNLLALLVLPMALPVVLGAAEATRLVFEGNLGTEWARWMQLLGAFDLIFVVAGGVLFEFAIEE